MDKAANIMWGVAGTCTMVWLIGWVALDAGPWIHTFIGTAIALGSLVLSHELREAKERR